MDDLLGLESEISAIQAGIQQIDKITPTPPMSFQTESMMPLNLGVPTPVQVSAKLLLGTILNIGEIKLLPQAPQVTEVATPPKRPVAVMSQAPPGRTDNYGMAPFLPPPPSKAGRRPDPPQEPKGGYAVFGPGVTAFDNFVPPVDAMDSGAPGESPASCHCSKGSILLPVPVLELTWNIWRFRVRFLNCLIFSAGSRFGSVKLLLTVHALG